MSLRPHESMGQQQSLVGLIWSNGEPMGESIRSHASMQKCLSRAKKCCVLAFVAVAAQSFQFESLFDKATYTVHAIVQARTRAVGARSQTMILLRARRLCRGCLSNAGCSKFHVLKLSKRFDVHPLACGNVCPRLASVPSLPFAAVAAQSI